MTKAIEVKDVSVAREGNVVSVPEHIPLDKAIEALTLKMQEENQKFAFNYVFEMTVPEGCLALLKALKDLFGFVNPTATPGFFNDTPPLAIGIEVGPGGRTEQVYWGRLVVPGIAGFLQTAIFNKNGMPCFRLVGEAKGKDRKTIDSIAAHMKAAAKERNLYKGHAIRVSFPEEGASIEDYFPKFMEQSKVGESDLIFSDDITKLVNDTLFTPIECTELCREHSIPLKRGILLEGPFGVGKTLTATVTAGKCVENDWTFLYLDDVTKLRQALEFARHHQPAVVFAEDIDQVLDDEEDRDAKVNEILNCIDGVESKQSEVIVILTTNSVEDITQAMLRPGRLDTVVPVRAPDARAAARLVQLFAGERLAENEDLVKVGLALAGQIPALIREVVERSKLGAVSRQRHKPGSDIRITGEDLITAADGMLAHMRLLEAKHEDDRAENIIAAETLGKTLTAGMKEVVGLLSDGRSHTNGSSPTTALLESPAPRDTPSGPRLSGAD